MMHLSFDAKRFYYQIHLPKQKLRLPAHQTISWKENFSVPSRLLRQSKQKRQNVQLLLFYKVGRKYQINHLLYLFYQETLSDT